MSWGHNDFTFNYNTTKHSTLHVQKGEGEDKRLSHTIAEYLYEIVGFTMLPNGTVSGMAAVVDAVTKTTISYQTFAAPLGVSIRFVARVVPLRQLASFDEIVGALEFGEVTVVQNYSSCPQAISPFGPAGLRVRGGASIAVGEILGGTQQSMFTYTAHKFVQSWVSIKTQWLRDMVQVNVFANESIILNVIFPDSVTWKSPYSEWFLCGIEKPSSRHRDLLWLPILRRRIDGQKRETFQFNDYVSNEQNNAISISLL